MSCSLVTTDAEAACANCGLVSSDATKLKHCTACRLVKYCGVDCQGPPQAAQEGVQAACGRAQGVQTTRG